MVSKSKQTLSFLAACLLMACSGGSDSTSIDAGPPAEDAAPTSASLEDICGEDGLFVAFLDKFEECLPEYSAFIGGFPSASTISQICTEGNTPYLEDGSVVLGPYSLVATCKAAVAAADCVEFDLDAIEECDGLLEGQVAASGDCDSDEMCAEKLYCDQSGTGDCGFCAALKPDGNSCASGDECIDGVCINGTCQGDGLAGSACEDNDSCRGRLVCDVVTEVCTSPDSYQVGDACKGFDGQCGIPFSGMYCNPSAKAGPSCENFRALGAACAPAEGALCDFFKGEACPQDVKEPTCIAAAEQADGQACDIFAGTKCESGSFCLTGDSGSAGICTAYLGKGESCEEDSEVSCSFLLECVGGSCQAGKHTGLCYE